MSNEKMWEALEAFTEAWNACVRWPDTSSSIARLEKAAVMAEEAIAQRGAQESPYRFERYVNGVRMAEGVTIEREENLQSAIAVAARIAARGPNGEAPVLVYVPAHREAQEPVANRYARDVASVFKDSVGAIHFTICDEDAERLPYGQSRLYTSPPPAHVPCLPPQSPCSMTEAEMRIFKLGWLECEAAHRALIAKHQGES